MIYVIAKLVCTSICKQAKKETFVNYFSWIKGLKKKKKRIQGLTLSLLFLKSVHSEFSDFWSLYRTCHVFFKSPELLLIILFWFMNRVCTIHFHLLPSKGIFYILPWAVTYYAYQYTHSWHMAVLSCAYQPTHSW